MTPRERALTILSGRQPDQVPWFADLDYLALSQVKQGLKPEGFVRSREYIDWHRELGVGFYLQGFLPLREIHAECGISVRTEGNLRIREIATQEGSLREIWQWMPSSYSEAPREYLVKQPEDLRAYRAFIRDTRFEADFEFARHRTEQIGDAGILVTYTPRTPFMQLLVQDSGIENLMTIFADTREELEATLEEAAVRYTEAVEIVAGGPGDVVMIPENLSSEMVGPAFFARYMRDVQSRWSQLIRDAAKHSCIHMDGTLRGLLREEAGVGLSFIEACTPAPVGDLAVQEWPHYIDGVQTILWGGLPGVYFTEKVTQEEFDRFILDEILPVMRSAPRYVLGVADQVPPDGLESRVMRVRDLVDAHGTY